MTDHNQHPDALLPTFCHRRHHYIAFKTLQPKSCMLGGIPVQVAAWERQAWQSVSVQVDEGTHRPQSLSASLPEAVLPAGK